MILPMPRSGGPSTALFSTLTRAFAGTAAMASMSSRVGARGLSAAKLPDRSKISPSSMTQGFSLDADRYRTRFMPCTISGVAAKLPVTISEVRTSRMNFPKPSVGMLPNDRLDYSAITKRKPLKLPKGARMVVWTITNVEEWDPTQTMPRTVLTPPAGGSPMPDIPNWCWHEYGNRVGFWRLLQVYDDFKIPGVMNINGVAVKAYPDIVKACVDRNWEFIGHGYTQRNMQKVENERADIRKSAEVLEEATGKRPRGWLGPGLTETWETPDILAEEGYDYVADWVLDDQPVWMKTRGKPILNIPYTQECNDVAMMLIQHHKASEFYERAMDQFEQIYKDAKGSARVMAISVHPYIMGAPHRAKYFRKIYEKIRKKRDVLFWTGSQIADWYTKVGPKAA